MGLPSTQRVPLHVLGWMFLLSESAGTPFNFVGGVSLRENVDERRLDRALRQVTRDLPPFSWRLERGLSEAWFRPGRSGPKRWPLTRLGRRFDLRREPPVRIYVHGPHLLGEASHVFCDGHGLLSYMNRVLALYLDVEPPPLPSLSSEDPIRAIVGDPSQHEAPPRFGRAPYRIAPQPRARKRWSLTLTLNYERLRRVSGRLGTSRRDLLLALYLLALGEQRARPGRALRLNAFMPENLRERFGVDSLFNCCGGLVLPLELAPSPDLGQLLSSIRQERQGQSGDAFHLRSLAGLVGAFGGDSFRRIPFALKQAGARLVSGTFSEQVQTELVTDVGTGVAHPRIAPHLARVFAIPAVKHTRWCSFGYGGVGETYCCSFRLRSADAKIPAAFARRLRALDPDLIVGAPLRFP
ncbi:MAG: hypothetical protein JKY65_11960 [Planctomycetes bacterium]|nr:hypothetical protein [Planctomycetota bacterium]